MDYKLNNIKTDVNNIKVQLNEFDKHVKKCYDNFTYLFIEYIEKLKEVVNNGKY